MGRAGLRRRVASARPEVETGRREPQAAPGTHRRAARHRAGRVGSAQAATEATRKVRRLPAMAEAEARVVRPPTLDGRAAAPAGV